MSIEKIQDKIVELCQSYWEENERVLLLSNLGESLEKDEITLIKGGGLNLHQFIANNLSSKVTIQRQRAGSPKIGIMPIDVKPPDDIDEIFQPSKPSISSRPFLSFQSDIWHAFISSIPEGQKRWLILDDPIKFIDQLEPPSSEHAVHEIDKTDLNQTEPPGKEFALSIKKWAEDKNIPLDRMTRERYLAKSNYSIHGLNLLDELFKKLNSNELSRISMPLDIVEKLYGIKSK